ncbi:hypothetical protein, partial [Limosilactobacillus reuteri]|uniref:hypothetical protein n=1 Tax=Limosilactobacillus reuteri TaxID=1598 RepID=UPI002AFF3652
LKKKHDKKLVIVSEWKPQLVLIIAVIVGLFFCLVVWLNCNYKSLFFFFKKNREFFFGIFFFLVVLVSLCFLVGSLVELGWGC